MKVLYWIWCHSVVLKSLQEDISPQIEYSCNDWVVGMSRNLVEIQGDLHYEKYMKLGHWKSEQTSDSVHRWLNELNSGRSLSTMITAIIWSSVKNIHCSVFEYLNDELCLIFYSLYSCHAPFNLPILIKQAGPKILTNLNGCNYN